MYSSFQLQFSWWIFFFFFAHVSNICLHGEAVQSFKLEFDDIEARRC